MRKTVLALVLLSGSLAALGAANRHKETSYPFREKEEIRRTLKSADPSRPLTLIVDNVFGGIDVQAASGTDVELVALKTIRAKSQEKIARAKAEVDLKIDQRGNDIDLYVDGPFRCQVQDCKGLRWRDWGYEVVYEFRLRVPRRTNLTLKTVNEGAVTARGIEGDFDVSNVNGPVTFEAVSGAGNADTVNGDVRIAFARNPAAPCSFETVNGDIRMSFAANLGADFWLKTMHGEASSDFESVRLPAKPAQSEKLEGKTIYRRGGHTGIRIGRGGPEIRCETLNGDILIEKNK